MDTIWFCCNAVAAFRKFFPSFLETGFTLGRSLIAVFCDTSDGAEICVDGGVDVIVVATVNCGGKTDGAGNEAPSGFNAGADGDGGCKFAAAALNAAIALTCDELWLKADCCCCIVWGIVVNKNALFSATFAPVHNKIF